MKSADSGRDTIMDQQTLENERIILKYVMMTGLDALMERHFPKTSETPTSKEKSATPEPPTKTPKKPRSGKAKIQSARYLAAKQFLEDDGQQPPQ